MKKYWQVIKITFEEYFEYRLNFLLWRFRSFVSFLTLFFFWLAIYGGKGKILGYEKAQMLAYVVGVAFLRSIVLGSRSADLAGQIRSGELTRYLIQPVKIFRFWFARDIADKFLNIFFTTLEICLVAKVLNFPLWFPVKTENIILFLISLILALFLYFFLSISLSTTGFWTEDVWATRWLFGIILLEFLAGGFFPLDVLPTWLTKIIYLTPFPHLIFFPLKILLEQVPLNFAVKNIFIALFWLGLFFEISKSLWKKGTKNYGAYGG